jgi:hypothetical protein
MELREVARTYCSTCESRKCKSCHEKLKNFCNTLDTCISKKQHENPIRPDFKIYMYDVERQFIEEFDSASEAAEAIDTTQNAINQACRTKFKHKGYYFERVEV